jgi:hypothetical protein
MQDRYKYIGCSVNKIMGYARGLPLLVGLGLVKLITSELWLGPSENSLTKFSGSSGQSHSGSGICRNFHGLVHDQLVITSSENSRVYMICKNVELRNA